MCVGRKFGVRWCVAKRCKFSKAQHGAARRVWQRNGAAWHEKFNEFSDTANSAWQVWRNGVCGQNKAWRHCKFSTEKMGRCLGGGLLSLSLSLVARAFWHAFGLNLKGFFTHFVVVLFRFIVDFAHFIAFSSRLIANFSYFIAILTHLFTHKRRFLGHCAFLKFLNALFLGFLCLSLRAVFAKTAWQSINLVLFLLYGLPRSPCSLAMTDKENALCHLARTDIFTQIAFKNLKNSTQRSQNDTF